MYDTSRASSAAYHERSRDAITSIVLAVVISAILYFVSVVVTEIWVLWNEESTRKKIARLRAKGSHKSMELDRELKDHKLKRGSTKGLSGGLAQKESAPVGATDIEFNPLMLSQQGAFGDGGAAPSNLIDALSANSSAPPPEMWGAFKQAFITMNKQMMEMQEQLMAARLAGSGEPGGMAMQPDKHRAEFSPSFAGAGEGGGAHETTNPVGRGGGASVRGLDAYGRSSKSVLSGGR